jgi:hypothetical protein
MKRLYMSTKCSYIVKNCRLTALHVLYLFVILITLELMDYQSYTCEVLNGHKHKHTQFTQIRKTCKYYGSVKFRVLQDKLQKWRQCKISSFVG